MKHRNVINLFEIQLTGQLNQIPISIVTGSLSKFLNIPSTWRHYTASFRSQDNIHTLSYQRNQSLVSELAIQAVAPYLDFSVFRASSSTHQGLSFN